MGAGRSHSHRGVRRRHEHIRRSGFESVWREAVADADAEDAGVASGDHIDVGVTDDDGFFRIRVRFAEKRLDAEWIGFFSMEAIAAVDLKEKFRKPERFADGTRRIHRLVAEHSQLARLAAISARREMVQSIDHMVVDIGVIEFVFAIISEEEIDGFGD